MAAKKNADRPAGEPTQQLGHRIPKSLYKRLDQYATEVERDAKDVLADAISQYLSDKKVRGRPA